jgi:predicted RNA-binding Zn-ribbon protein involved in translation (DUF1610 family)
MNCPNCGEPMLRGTATLDKTWANWFLFQWGSTNLVFRDEESGKVTLMTPWSIARSFLCQRCGSVTLATDLAPRKA